MIHRSIAFFLVLFVTTEAFAPRNAAENKRPTVAVSLAAESVLSAVASLDPAVVGGIAASVLGGVAVSTVGRTTEPNIASQQTAASTVDVSIPYDAAARLAFDEYLACDDSSDNVLDFETFKLRYEQMTVASITAKQLEREVCAEASSTKVDVSIPYDAAAKLAYQKWLDAKGQWGSDDEYQVFKSKYEKMSVAQATLKKLERDMA